MTDLKLSAETTHNNPASTSGALRFDTTNMDGAPASGYTEFDDIAALLMVPGQLYGGYIQPSDTGSGLKLEILTDAGNTPSATAPVRVKINRTVREITAACTFTIADGTNWMNAGGAELATKEIDYFAYVVWDSNSSVVALSASRIPFGRVVSDFSATTTNEKHLINYANFTATDDVEVCGRFAATLSAGAGYTWTVPTYTNINLVQRPTLETRPLVWVPVWSAAGLMTIAGTVTLTHARYQIVNNRVMWQIKVSAFTLGGTASNIVYSTLPFNGLLGSAVPLTGAMLSADAGGTAFGGTRLDNTTPDRLAWIKYTAAGWTLGAGTVINGNGWYEV